MKLRMNIQEISPKVKKVTNCEFHYWSPLKEALLTKLGTQRILALIKTKKDEHVAMLNKVDP
jgi:hypothetical protein